MAWTHKLNQVIPGMSVKQTWHYDRVCVETASVEEDYAEITETNNFGESFFAIRIGKVRGYSPNPCDYGFLQIMQLIENNDMKQLRDMFEFDAEYEKEDDSNGFESEDYENYWDNGLNEE